MRSAQLPLNLYIAVSTRLYRDGLVQALGIEPRVNIVGAHGSLDTIFDDLRRLRPDIVLVDISAQQLFSAIPQIRNAAASTRVVALAVPDSRTSAIACAEAGVAGYVTRDGRIEDLVRIMLLAHAGEFECSPGVAAALVSRLRRQHRLPLQDLTSLTRRELEIIRLLEQGLSNKEIARRLSIKLPTVKNHVHNIIGKLHVKGRCEAAALYRRLSNSH